MVGTTISAKASGKIAHIPRLQHPWFADADEGVTIHRYFDEEFVPRFVQEAMNGRLQGTRAQAWYRSDRFGRADLPTLRLPMHQTFYMVSCEVRCCRAGEPAYDPARIVCAGFVVRRRCTDGREQRWLLQQGQVLGWQDGAISDQEPDEYRRLLNRKLIAPRFPEPGYSGEESYPLHPLSVCVKSGTEMQRHTLLWGYLPLGGSYRIDNTAPLPPTDAVDALRNELSWPFGEANARAWIDEDSRPVFKGIATQAFYQLLNLLLTRYRVFDSSDEENQPLRSVVATIHFYPPMPANPDEPYLPYGEPSAEVRGESLLAWIEASRDRLITWLTTIEMKSATLSTSALPNQAGGTRNDDLYLTQDQADTLRDALMLRGGQAMVAHENGLAMPRFGQSDDDRFFIVPFVRWRDECGCERIHWGSHRSIDFRVVSPLDPEAQRPRAVILPGLSDLKRGAVRGVTLLAPKSLADVMRRIKPDMKMEQGGPGNSCGLCWNFSFSLPAITICAAMALMALISLLNLFLGWIPWAFLAVPKLCGKLLSENKS